jgi:hypothetical protein
MVEVKPAALSSCSEPGFALVIASRQRFLVAFYQKAGLGSTRTNEGGSLETAGHKGEMR